MYYFIFYFFFRGMNKMLLLLLLFASHASDMYVVEVDKMNGRLITPIHLAAV